MSIKADDKPQNTIGVYAIERKLTGKRYIGSSVNIGNRWKQHISSLNSGRHENQHLQRAWKKYGAENFIFVILETCNNRSDALNRENWYLENTNCYYNIASHSSMPLLGKIPSQETKFKRLISKQYCVSVSKLIKIHEALTGTKMTDAEIKNVKIEHKAKIQRVKEGDYDELFEPPEE